VNKPPQLIIPLDEIPTPGLRVGGDLPEEWLAESLLEPYAATSPMSVEIDLKRIGDNILVQGSLELGVSFKCSRTGAPDSQQLSIEMSELFQPVNSNTMNFRDAEISSEELGSDEPFVYEGNRIDLEPFVRESLVLAQDPFPTHSEATEPKEGSAAWSSRGDEIDPRWAQLKDLELS
tara:strand:+ start:85 stop:615 length:531 start_codon:yes stop_codon:yes gene_type:complete